MVADFKIQIRFLIFLFIFPLAKMALQNTLVLDVEYLRLREGKTPPHHHPPLPPGNRFKYWRESSMPASPFPHDILNLIQTLFSAHTAALYKYKAHSSGVHLIHTNTLYIHAALNKWQRPNKNVDML
jgi:hypothetical protein